MSKGAEIAISTGNFYDKVARIVNVLESEDKFNNVLAFIINLGLVKDEETQPKTCLFHLWLL